MALLMLLGLATQQAQAPFPPPATGQCSGPAACAACISDSCIAELAACDEHVSCTASAACMDSAIADHHVARTPTDCQSLDCVAPCFVADAGDGHTKSAKKAPDAQAIALLECVATCLPQTMVPPDQPQQVHLAFAGVGTDSVAVSWTTESNATRSSVMYGAVGGGAELLADGE